MNIVTEYPAWFIIFCLLTGAVFAAILYRKNPKHEFSKLVVRTLMVFRFISISIISFMLLSPLLKSVQHSVENPVIIFAQDNSQSITLGKDTVGGGAGMETRIASLIDDLEEDFEVRTFSFSDGVNEGLDLSMEGKQTDMSLLFDELITRFSNRNVGALIVSSDGLYNSGMNPLYASEKIKFPIYTIALGDTNVRRDLFIRKVNFNRIAFLGNTFPIEIVMGANQCRGLKSVLTVAQSGDMVFSKNIDITDDQFSEIFLRIIDL